MAKNIVFEDEDGDNDLKVIHNIKDKVTLVINDERDYCMGVFSFESEEDVNDFINVLNKVKKSVYGNI